MKEFMEEQLWLVPRHFLILVLNGGASKNNTLYVVNHSCIPTLLEQLQPFGTLYCCPFLAPCPRLDHKRAPGEEYLSNIKIMNIKYISFCMFVHTFSNKGFQPTVQLSKSMVSSNSSEPLYNNVFNSNFGTHTKEQNSFANLTFGKLRGVNFIQTQHQKSR